MLKIRDKKTSILILILFILLLIFLISPKNVFAQAENAWEVYGASDDPTGVGGILGWIVGSVMNLAMAPIYVVLGILIYALVWFIGHLSTVFIYLLFVIVKYNNFVNEDIVKEGWVLIRDLCNMFFILGLLIIAFATILRMETYGNKRMLAKLLIMAVLINFSKTICGLFIDFAQVIMLTFVQPILNPANGAWGHGALVNALGLQKMITISQIGDMAKAAIPGYNYFTDSKASALAIFGSMLLGLILLIIATVAIAAYSMILLIRIITLWVLIMLSPIAFLLAAFPGAQQYASRWWSEFTKALVVGPTMAFFFWLAIRISNLEQDKKIGTGLGFAYKTSDSAIRDFTSGFLNQIIGEDLSDIFNFLL